jgi:hypothetical protein
MNHFSRMGLSRSYKYTEAIAMTHLRHKRNGSCHKEGWWCDSDSGIRSQSLEFSP